MTSSMPRSGRPSDGEIPRAVRSLACAIVLVAAAAATAAAAPPLQALARTTLGASQGVYVEAADGTVLAAQHAARPVHPASVTKIASTFVLLRTLGPDYRFDTRLLADGVVRGDTIEGDLVIAASRDPFFVYESAYLLLAALRERGIRRIRGGLRVDGGLLFNWQPDPDGARLRLALAGNDESAESLAAWKAVQQWRGELADFAPSRAALVFDGATLEEARLDANTQALEALALYRSPPLRKVLKALNGYSNNVFHLVSDVVGGAAAIEGAVREALPADLRDEVTITNAAGAGTTNRMSPRVAVAVVRLLDREAKRHGLDLVDLLPVAGIDRGTLADRLGDAEIRGAVVAKTGTYGSLGISSLAGVARTKRYGDVAFAVLNEGLGVESARRRQDAFVRALLVAAGAEPFAYTAAAPTPLLDAAVAVVRDAP